MQNKTGSSGRSEPDVRLLEKQQNLIGIGALVIATLFFATQDAITKFLVTDLPAPQIVAVRFFFFSIFAILYASRKIGLARAFQSAKKSLQVVRGLLIVAEITLFAAIIRYLGLAEMHTLFACFPLIITMLSGPFLGEKVGWRRWLAVVCGFLGTVIILRPGTGVFEPIALAAIGVATMFAFYNILTRKLAKHDTFETSLLYFGVVGFVASALIAPFVWVPLGQLQWVGLGVVSFTAIVGHLLLIKALELAPAVILQPFNYFVLIWAIIIGYVLFDERLDWVSWLGSAIVVTSGIFIAYREYRLLRTPEDN
ncbi:MAG: DMT family transporter [Pseudomonadota bacterium]